MMPFDPADDPLFRQWFQPSAPPCEDDVDLAFRVADRLRAELPPGCDIVVEVQNRVVMLEGTVPTRSVCVDAHRTTWQVPGVIDVSNRLAVWCDDPDLP